jgi:hypothetical protein
VGRQLNAAWLVVSACAAGWAVATALPASADCADIPNLMAELPRERLTPNGTHLAFSYDIERSSYSVTVRRDAESFVFADLQLKPTCHPGDLRWESDEFVALERGCGSFCWGVDILATTAQRRFNVFRPLAFLAERKLVVSYADWDVIGVTSLATGYVQLIPTARHCLGSTEVCFEAGIEGDSLVYVWQDGNELSVPLDGRLFE